MDGTITTHRRGADAPVTSLDELHFDARFTQQLPTDPDTTNRRRQVHGAAFSRVAPTPVAAPRTLAWSPEVAALLGLDPELCASDDFAAVFSGNRVPAGADPFAACYGGHQFGNWAGQLGDGRAIALGEVLDLAGHHQTLQLKGAGPTPYSRTADGRAVLRSSLREFLCSEAMFHLGVPTTRALSLVATGNSVLRDMFYDGNPAPEPGAVVCRVAPSFTRFGTFQLPASRGELTLLRTLVEFTIRNDFPHLRAEDFPTFNDQVAAWFTEVCERTATLAAHWMRVGFVHGVLNTDNMSILGLTIDYGPYGWLESFDPNWTPNTTDAGMLRYKFGTQPEVCQWNLLQLAHAVLALTEQPEPLQSGLDRFRTTYDRIFETTLAARLGFGELQEGDGELFQDLFTVLGVTETDYILFFRLLAAVPVEPDASDAALLEPLDEAWYRRADLDEPSEARDVILRWLRRWGARARSGGLADAERRAAMNALNPRYVLRNYLAQEAIDAAEQGDVSLLHELMDVLRNPYTDQPGRERFAARRPEWARVRAGCSMLSCSS